MGEHDTTSAEDPRLLRSFMKAILGDLQALEYMLDKRMFEEDARRIGAEQEMFLVDKGLQPAGVAPDVLTKVGDPRLTTELARFNLEANLSPQTFTGGCLRAMEAEAVELVGKARSAARDCGADVLLAGILPTLRLSDLTLDNMTPVPRYFQLNEVMKRLRGGSFHVVIKGLDELEVTHDNVLLESANTSFQVHFQVGQDEFAHLYNISQLVSGPVLAAAVNSPLFLGNRLWRETRVALFQRSIDARSSTHTARGHRPRVNFGDSWVKKSILEIFREDVARYRVVLANELEEDPKAVLERGELPELSALRLHNGTVWRWNRACYGVSKGAAHLRIENRILPAGPSIRDEVANAALFFGLMAALSREYSDVTREIAKRRPGRTTGGAPASVAHCSEK